LDNNEDFILKKNVPLIYIEIKIYKFDKIQLLRNLLNFFHEKKTIIFEFQKDT